LRAHLAKQHNADFTCPLTCGIFVNVAAHASEERGGDDITPWWRTLKKDGELNEKYPEGIDNQKLRLEMEGHTVIQKGKRYFVKDYKDKLFEMT
jgi:nickel-dependent lactate racemase